jgi:hypothetical protein
MATIPNTPMLLSADSQAGLLNFHNQAIQLSAKLWNLRSQFERADKAYMREVDKTTENQRAVLSNLYGDPTKFRNIIVPVVLPQVEGAVVYQSSVFLTGNPIIGVVASPEFQDEATQMNSVIEEQQIRGGWVAEFQKHFRDGFKYNLAAMEVSWCREVTASLETDLDFSATQAKPKETIWEGNKIKKLDLYNTHWDTRVHPTEVSTKGEFAGYTELMSRVALKNFFATLPSTTNVKEAFESGTGGNGNIYYTPVLNPGSFISDDVTSQQGRMDWMAWVHASKSEVKIDYKNMYEVSTMYARIIPSDFKLRVPSANTPQIWKLIIVNHTVIVYAERQTNAHGRIPILFSQPLDDGLGHQTKALAENVMPMQALASALWNANIAARRRAISDRGIYDPSKIDAKHINSDVPNAKIPVRPSAYGQPVNSAYYPIPFRDDQAGTITQEAGSVTAMANMVSGQNQVRQGQFVKGNKTQSEFDTVMGNANGRDQSTSMLLEAQLFTPLKEIIKLNNLQFQGGTSIYNREEGRVIEVDPIKLRKAILAFKMSDGLLPTDKLINADTLRNAISAISTSPQLGAGYNIAAAFSYLMKTQGVDLKPFEKSAEQLTYEQAVSSWQQVVMEALKEGASKEQLPPQPTPEQFNYVPSNQVASSEQQPGQMQGAQ